MSHIPFSGTVDEELNDINTGPDDDVEASDEFDTNSGDSDFIVYY